MLPSRSSALVAGVTPLEVGVFGAVSLFFGAALRGFSPRGSWWAALLVTLLGATLAGVPGNLYLVDWTSSGGASFLPGGPTYWGGHLHAGLTAADVKFLVLTLFGGAAVAFVRGSPSEGEPLLIGLVALVAGLVTVTTDNLVLLYLSLELQALSLYTLVGFYRFDEERTDSAVRYLLSGSLVSGFMLVSFARHYSLNGSFYLHELTELDPLGSAWMVGVLLFKVGVFPFHFWSPVVYAPLEWGTLGVTLGATKVNVWYLLLVTLRPAVDQTWWPLWWVGLASILVGSLGGFFQTNVGSLLAYSGVINGGYLSWLLLGGSPWSFGYYGVAYFTGTLGLVVWLSAWPSTRVETFTGWGKLGVAFPLVGYYLTLNVGGLPVFPGFFAKVVLIQGTATFGFTLLVVLVAASIIPAVYYVTTAGVSLFNYSDREVVLPAVVSPPSVLGMTLVCASLVVGFTTVVFGGVA